MSLCLVVAFLLPSTFLRSHAHRGWRCFDLFLVCPIQGCVAFYCCRSSSVSLIFLVFSGYQPAQVLLRDSGSCSPRIIPTCKLAQWPSRHGFNIWHTLSVSIIFGLV